MLTHSLVGEIIARFEKRGFKLVALKLNQPSKEQLEKHYADLKDKPFFPSLVKYSEYLLVHHPFRQLLHPSTTFFISLWVPLVL